MRINRIDAIWKGIQTNILKLNMFDDSPEWDHYRRQTEIIATRIYLLLLTLTIGTLVIYTSLEVRIQTRTVNNPSVETFEQLQSNLQYSSILECPCKNVAVPYGQFISVSSQLHQLCTSDFVIRNSLWLDLMYYRLAGLVYSHDDFRVFIVPHFRLIASLCALANETLTNAVQLFDSSTIVSKQVESRRTIEIQANASIAQFHLSTTRTFLGKLEYIRHMMQGNGIMSSILSNWHFRTFDRSRIVSYLWTEPRSYGHNNCSCGTNATCTSTAIIDEWIVPGFLIGCYQHEALLQSTLECLYDTQCINKLKTIYSSSNATFLPLNPTLSSPNETVQSLVEKLMVAEWQTNVIYEQYYNACAPLSCNYFVNQKASSLYIINTIIGLYGGLTITFKLIVPVSVRIGRNLIIRRRHQVQPIATIT